MAVLTKMVQRFFRHWCVQMQKLFARIFDVLNQMGRRPPPPPPPPPPASYGYAKTLQTLLPIKGSSGVLKQKHSLV